jgi:hypothetical protein
MGGGIRNIPPAPEFPLRALPLPIDVTDIPSSREVALITSFFANSDALKDDFFFGCGRGSGFLTGRGNASALRSGVAETLGLR